MDIFKTLFSLTPYGILIFSIGLLFMIVAISFFREPSASIHSSYVSTVPKQVPPPKPQSVEVIIKVESWEKSAPIKINDKNSKSATIEVVVLSKDFTWKLGSYNTVERFGVPTLISSHLSSSGISREIGKYPAIIAVGAASYEGASEYPNLETIRARRRAAQLQLWVREYATKPAEVYELSIGFSKIKVPVDQSPPQRRVVLVGIIRKDEGINLTQALRDRLSQIKVFPFKLEQYSEFQLKHVL